MNRFFGRLSSGMNGVLLAGIIFLGAAGVCGNCLAQDGVTLAVGQREATTALSVKDIKLSGDLLYQATDEVLTPVSSRAIRRLDKPVCMVSEEDNDFTLPAGYDAVGGNSIEQLATKYLPDPSLIVLLRVERKFDAGSFICGALEFTYAQNNDLAALATPAPVQVPVKKK